MGNDLIGSFLVYMSACLFLGFCMGLVTGLVFGEKE